MFCALFRINSVLTAYIFTSCICWLITSPLDQAVANELELARIDDLFGD